MYADRLGSPEATGLPFCFSCWVHTDAVLREIISLQEEIK